MRKVGADDDQRAFIAPKQVEHFGNLFGRGLANRKGHQREGSERVLQEGQVHFERMLMCVRVVADANLRQMPDRSDRFTVQPDFAQWRGKSIGRGQSQTANVDTVGRTEQHHTGVLVAKRRQQRVGVRRDRARIDISGVRCDQHLGSLWPGWRRGSKERRDLRLQRGRSAWIKGAGNCRCPD